MPEINKIELPNESLLWEHIPEEAWANASKRALRNNAAFLIVHPSTTSPKFLDEISLLSTQDLFPILVLVEADKMRETRKMFMDMGVDSVLLIPTFPGYPFPFTSLYGLRKDLSRIELANALREKVEAKINTAGGWETRSNEPDPQCIDVCFSLLSEKLVKMGVKKLILAGQDDTSVYRGSISVVSNRLNNFCLLPTSAIISNKPQDSLCPTLAILFAQMNLTEN